MTMHERLAPTLVSEVGDKFDSALVARAMSESDEICTCGRTHESHPHADDCDDARHERFLALRHVLNGQTRYIELKVA